MSDINLNGDKDGVRMTWPRAFTIATFLIVVGIVSARFEYQLRDLRRQNEERAKTAEKMDAKLDALVDQVTELRLAIGAPPPEIDRKGRILKPRGVQ